MTEQSPENNEIDISEKDVCAYLRENSDFFVNHPDLLTDINLPHESGGAISLVERQVALLRERNMEMRHRLSKLLDNARDNDRLFDKTQRLVLTLLESRSLGDLINAVLSCFDRDFEIAHTSIILFGDESRLPESGAHVRTILQAQEAVGRILTASKTICGNFSADELSFLFPGRAEQIGSAAVVPLVYGNCFGLLSIGNSDPLHYRSSMGTLFLGYIGEVLNRLLPRHLAY